jgi:hypothetical protein
VKDGKPHVRELKHNVQCRRPRPVGPFGELWWEKVPDELHAITDHDLGILVWNKATNTMCLL